MDVSADKVAPQRRAFRKMLDRAEWNNTIVLKGPVEEEIRRLKQQPGGDIRLSSSAMLAQALIQTGLVDEYRLLVHPVVCGRGKRLFADGMETAHLKLIESPAFRSGAVLLRYGADRTAG
ncbi:MAG: dihydrofolate reductase family protein [Roseiflexaceae bacterium]